MPTPRLTPNEKRARGTLQRSRIPKPRSLPEIDVAISDTLDLIESLMLVLKKAKESVRTDGIQSIVTARDNANRTTTATKLSPAVKLVLTIPAQVRLARRELVILNEERETAEQKEAAANLPDEFAGLD
jgi:hypothetical protein